MRLLLEVNRAIFSPLKDLITFLLHLLEMAESNGFGLGVELGFDLWLDRLIASFTAVLHEVLVYPRQRLLPAGLRGRNEALLDLLEYPLLLVHHTLLSLIKPIGHSLHHF